MSHGAFFCLACPSTRVSVNQMFQLTEWLWTPAGIFPGVSDFRGPGELPPGAPEDPVLSLPSSNNVTLG